MSLSIELDSNPLVLSFLSGLLNPLPSQPVQTDWHNSISITFYPLNTQCYTRSLKLGGGWGRVHAHTWSYYTDNQNEGQHTHTHTHIHTPSMLSSLCIVFLSGRDIKTAEMPRKITAPVSEDLPRTVLAKRISIL